MNKDLIEPLKELEYMLREGVVFDNVEKNEIWALCVAIINNLNERD